jgi:hypothetical protein
VALADTGRRLQRENARRRRVGIEVGERAVEKIQQARLLGARRGPSREGVAERRAQLSRSRVGSASSISVAVGVAGRPTYSAAIE